MSPELAARRLHLVCRIVFISLAANQAALCLGDAAGGASGAAATSGRGGAINSNSGQPLHLGPSGHLQHLQQHLQQHQLHHNHHNHHNQQQQQQQQQQLISKKGAQAWQNQNLSKFQKYLSEHQQELVRKNPGSLWAVARAIKMAIKECQYQMRNEPWDCPIHGFSVRPPETFGMLMSRSFKQTSFIQSLLSSAIAHSVARACTESVITTCSRKQLPHGNGFGEDIEFGRQFARDFMDVTRELQQQQQFASESVQKALISANSIMPPAMSGELQHALRVTSGAGASYYSGASKQQQQEPMWKEKRLRQMINVHNDEVGRLIVLNYMRRECKCHGISGACSMQTCWHKLPPFRDVANRLHDSLDKALRVEMYVAPQGNSLATNRHKLLTSASVKKSNKKRSSSLQQPSNPFSGLGRSSTPPAATFYTTTATTITGAAAAAAKGPASMGATSMDGGGRLQAHQELQAMNSISSSDSLSGGPGDGGAGAGTGGGVNDLGGIDKQLAASSDFAQQDTIQYASLLSAQQTNSTAVKRRPIARSIGPTASTLVPGKLDLLYAEESPDFCVPSERYNIKGTKGRICSESPDAANSCGTLCCGRGYKTEIREEKYTCECEFQFCCNLRCNTCTRRKVVNKCL